MLHSNSMKRIYILLSAFFLFSAAHAQITITVDDLATEGDVIYFSNASPLGEFDLTADGPDQVWDYSWLDQTGQDSSVWVDPFETNPAYFLLWFGSSVAEETGQTFSSDFFSLEDIYNFYDRNEGELSITGIAGTVTGIPLPASFDDADVLYELPLNYNDSYSSASGFAFSLPGIGSWSESRNRSCLVDGYGEVTTPYGTFDALRVNCELLVTDVVEYSGIEFPISYTTREYRWMAPGMKIPVLFISSQEILGFETVTNIQYIDSLDGAPVGIQLPTAVPEILVTPTLVQQGLCQLQLGDPVGADVIITDLQGKQVLENIHVAPGQSVSALPVGGLHAGWYWCMVKQGEHLVSRPFLIAE